MKNRQQGKRNNRNLNKTQDDFLNTRIFNENYQRYRQEQKHKKVALYKKKVTHLGPRAKEMAITPHICDWKMKECQAMAGGSLIKQRRGGGGGRGMKGEQGSETEKIKKKKEEKDNHKRQSG